MCVLGLGSVDVNCFDLKVCCCKRFSPANVRADSFGLLANSMPLRGNLPAQPIQVAVTFLVSLDPLAALRLPRALPVRVTTSPTGSRKTCFTSLWSNSCLWRPCTAWSSQLTFFSFTKVCAKTVLKFSISYLVFNTMRLGSRTAAATQIALALRKFFQERRTHV